MMAKLKTYFQEPKVQRLPYLILFILCSLQFGSIYFNPEPLATNFWMVVGIILGILLLQIWWNHPILWVLILTVFSLLIFYLILAFLSDLLAVEASGFAFFRFLMPGLLFFGLLFFTKLLLIFSKP